MSRRNDPYFELGATTHGLTLLGARNAAEVQRMGFDVVYSDHLRDTGGEAVVDVLNARVVFPTVDLGVLAAGEPRRQRYVVHPPAAPVPWATDFAMFVAYQRRQGLLEVRRQADAARARLGLLSADVEDNVIGAGGTVYGAQAWNRRGLVPVHAGAAASPAVRRIVGRRAGERR